MNNLSDRLKELNKNLKHIDKEEPLDIEVKESFQHIVSELSDKTKFQYMSDEDIENYKMTKVEEQLLSFENEELLTIIEIAYEIATTEEEFDGTYESTMNIIKKAIFRIKKNPDLVIKVKNYEEEKSIITEKIKKLNNYLSEEMKDIGLWNDGETEEMKKKIIEYAFDDKKILNKEITKDLASELIEQFM